MKKETEWRLCLVGFIALVAAAIIAALTQLAYTFAHPALTYTQVFLKTWPLTVIIFMCALGAAFLQRKLE